MGKIKLNIDKGKLNAIIKMGNYAYNKDSSKEQQKLLKDALTYFFINLQPEYLTTTQEIINKMDNTIFVEKQDQDIQSYYNNLALTLLAEMPVNQANIIDREHKSMKYIKLEIEAELRAEIKSELGIDIKDLNTETIDSVVDDEEFLADLELNEVLDDKEIQSIKSILLGENQEYGLGALMF